MGSLFTLDAPLRLLSVKCWKKIYKSKFQVVGGQTARYGRVPLMNALCHGYICDILGEDFILWSCLPHCLSLFNFSLFLWAIYQSSVCLLDSGFTFITWQHAFSISLGKHCSRLLKERLLMQKLCWGANLDIFRELLDSFCSGFQLILRYENLGFYPTGQAYYTICFCRYCTFLWIC